MGNTDQPRNTTGAQSGQNPNPSDQESGGQHSEDQHAGQRPGVGKQASIAASTTTAKTATTKRPRLTELAEKQQSNKANDPAKSKEQAGDKTPEDKDEPSDIIELLRAGAKTTNPIEPGKETQEKEIDTNKALMKRLMARALAAEITGDDIKANLYLDMYAEAKSKIVTAKWSYATEESATPAKPTSEPSRKMQVKQGGLSFVANRVNTFLDMGLPPYFNKNMKELKGPLPITIFNKRWQDVAMIHHSEKRQRSSESSADKDTYTGLRYPSKWEQIFSEWTINHRGFHKSLRDVYKFD
ncbi:hypothetical protein PCANC_23884 [Puccinia coronata f. sp. avenae]|uniref:Uncharacterized protein n=1 Tax=Puccinia coronata f. sp. avenae TaxID=200324 RepID=A0A2N5TZ32_9BASI|nr:hypothetical protein PCANC_23884 [Puccinia coronata f. sp. avenae]